MTERPTFEALEPRLLMAADYEVVDLGTLGGPQSDAVALNAPLTVVGRSLAGPSPSTARAYRRDADGTSVNLGVLDGFDQSQATGINDASVTVGTSLNATFDERAFLHRDGEPLVDLGTLGGAWSRAAAINNAGQVAGTSAIDGDDNAFAAFIWQGGLMQNLGTLGGTSSFAKAINEAGQVVGSSFVAASTIPTAFVWDQGVMTALGTLGGPAGSANAINDAGIIVGDADKTKLDDNGFERFNATLWSGGETIGVGTLGGQFSSATSINNQEFIVGWSETKRKDAVGNRIEHAFVHKGSKMLDLNSLIDDDRWTLTRASAINDDGYIVGVGEFRPAPDAPAQEHGFILRPLYADFVLGIRQIRLADLAVPGDRGQLWLDIANHGENDANGRVIVEIFASTDQQLDDADALIHRRANQRIRLQPDQARTLRYNFTVGPHVEPGQYHLIAKISVASDIDELDTSNNTAASDQVHEVDWLFGTFADRRNVRMTVAAPGAEPLTFSIKGDGMGRVVNTAGGLDIVVDETNNRSTLTINGKRRDEQAAIGNATINASIKKINAQGIDLSGDLNVVGSVNEIRFDDAEAGNTITIGTPGGPDAIDQTVDLYLDQALDLSVLSQTALDQVKATSWLDGGGAAEFIDAPSLARLSITGNRKNRIDGDLGAALKLAGTVLTSKGLVLGAADIAGRITGGHWTIDGPAGDITAAAIDQSWQAQIAGHLAKLSVDTDLAGELSAASIAKMFVGQDLHDIVINLGPDALGEPVLGNLFVGGLMQRVNLNAIGDIGSLSVGSVEDTNVFAGLIPDLVKLPDRVGDFATQSSIGKVTVRGLTEVPNSVRNTLVSAWEIGRLNITRAGALPDALPDAAALGIAAHDIGSVVFKSITDNIRLRRPEDFLSLDSDLLMVKLI